MNNWREVLSWAGADIPLTGISKDGIKHEILSLWRDDLDRVVLNKEIVALKYRFQYLSQLLNENYIERIGKGLYKLTLKGKQALSQLGFYSGKSSYKPEGKYEWQEGYRRDHPEEFQD